MKKLKKIGQNAGYTPILSLSDLENTFTPVWREISSEDEAGLEYDDFKDSLEREHRVYRIEIDWNQFSELEIQTLIAILFQSLDYSVENWHNADRAREDRADLIVRNNKESIAIAVKIK